jgi:hypothetical protein
MNELAILTEKFNEEKNHDLVLGLKKKQKFRYYC